MKPFARLFDRVAPRHPRVVPPARLSRAAASPGHGLEPRLCDIVEQACASGRLEAAEDLLTLLERWHAQDDGLDQSEWRHRKGTLTRLRATLNQAWLVTGWAAA